MSDLPIAGSVTRTNLPGSLADLNLNDGTNFQIVAVGPGGRTQRKSYAKGNTRGGTLTFTTPDIEVIPLTIRVLGATQAGLESNLALLVDAFCEQVGYQLTITKDGQTNTYDCTIADISPAGGNQGEWDKFGLMSKRQTYQLLIDRQPDPIVGAL